MSQSSVREAYRRKLATNPDGEIGLDTLEISHPSMSKTYWLVADKDQLIATLETGAVMTFEPASINAQGGGNNNDMDQQASFTIADPDNVLDDEMELIQRGSGDYPKFTFRRFLLSDLSYPAEGPVLYEAQSITQQKGVFTASVGVPRLNQQGTGLIATPTDIPPLRGILA
jgi:hypothetical protein